MPFRPIRLGVNIDHVATVRNARGGAWPDPVRAAQLAVESGADGITAHLREDRRHIVDADIEGLIRECPQQYLWSYGRYKPPRAQAHESAPQEPADA